MASSKLTFHEHNAPMQVFNAMDQWGLPRDAITYSAVISSLSKGRQWSLGECAGSVRLVTIALFKGIAFACGRRVLNV